MKRRDATRATTSGARAAPKRGAHAEASATLFDAAQALIGRALAFDAPLDRLVGEFFRVHRRWGSRDRALLADVVYCFARERPVLEAVARDAPLPKAAALAWLAWPEAHLAAADLVGSLDARRDAAAAWLLDARARRTVLASTLPHNLPTWLAATLSREVGEAPFAALAASLLEPAPLDLRVNALKAKRDDVARALAHEGIETEPTRYAPWGLRARGKPTLTASSTLAAGLIEVQDEGSQLIAALVDPKRGEMVADFCAGAGGKTLALGAAMKNTGRLYAMDVSASRLAALPPRLARAGLDRVYTMAIADENDPRLERLAGKLDRVLVDAPCSGLGTLRRSPDLKWRVGESEIAAMAARQVNILRAASRLVKPGGRLVYATCSLLQAENEVVVAAFGSETGGRRYAVEDAAAVLRPSVGDSVDELVADGALRLWPHRHGTDGFFAAAWKRHL